MTKQNKKARVARIILVSCQNVRTQFFSNIYNNLSKLKMATNPTDLNDVNEGTVAMDVGELSITDEEGQHQSLR
jgi:signal recognition particle receptor subunit beta